VQRLRKRHEALVLRGRRGARHQLRSARLRLAGEVGSEVVGSLQLAVCSWQFAVGSRRAQSPHRSREEREEGRRQKQGGRRGGWPRKGGGRRAATDTGVWVACSSQVRKPCPLLPLHRTHCP
jgi:hypothetical protein